MSENTNQNQESRESLVQELNKLKSENAELIEQIEKQVIEREAVEESFRRQNNVLLKLNDFSLELAYKPYQEVFSLIVTKIKEFYNVKGAWITSYDEKNSDLIVEYSSLSLEENKKLTKLLGRRLLKMRVHVEEVHYKWMTTDIVSKMSSVNELTFGAIPNYVGKVIEKLFDVGWFLGLALIHKNKLQGTLILMGGKNHEPPDRDEIAAFGGIASNALGRKKAEESLQEKEQNYREIVESSLDTIMILDAETGQILDVNSSMLKMYGYESKEEALNCSIEELSASKYGYNQKKIDEMIQKALESTINSFEWLAKKKNDDIFWVEVTLKNILLNGESRILANLRDIDERKRAEQALRESEYRFSVLSESAFEGIVISENAVIIELNQRMADMFGYAREEMIGMPALKTAAPDSYEILNKYIVMPDIVTPYEYNAIRKNGEIFPVEVRAKNIPYKNKTVRVTSIRDLTERALAEKQLRLSEEKFSKVFSSNPSAVFICDIYDGSRFVDCNIAFEKLINYSREDIIGNTIDEIQFFADQNLFSDISGKLKESGHIHDLEFVFKKRQGELATGILSVETIEIKDRTYAIFSIKDITTRKQAEEQIIKIKQTYQDIFNTIIEAIYVLDETGTFIEVNKSAEKMYMCSREELIGQSPATVAAPGLNDLQKVKDMMNLVQQNNIPARFDFWAARKNGDVFPKDVIVSKGKYFGKDVLIATARDITEQKKYEQDIQELNESLERKVIERTEELQEALKRIEESNDELKLLNDSIADEAQKLLILNEKLAVSESELRIANQTKDRFFSIIAHDLKNPIGAIRNMLETFKLYYKKMNQAEVEKLIIALHNSSNHTVELLENLLQWARIQSDKVQFTYIKSSVSESVYRCCNTLKELANQKNITFSIDIPDQLFGIYDVNSIDVVLRNLITNAIKFSNHGGSIDIKAQANKITKDISYSHLNIYAANAIVDNRQNITIVIKDNGVGMPEDVVSKLFKIEQNIVSPGTSNERGTGLGLILCKEYVEKHNGRIWVESELEKGSAFCFTLPKAL